MKKVVIYTDGGCRGNPGPGGWGAVLEYDGHHKELKGFAKETTNNQMELKAAIEALASLTRACEVELHTDSVYVKDGITKWLENWKQRDWRTAGRKPVKNKALWQALDEQNQRHKVEWFWVKGHAGVAGNERADALANQAMDDQA